MALTDDEKNILNNYTEILRQYIDPEISRYSPIGWRKIPKVKRLESQRVSDERYLLEKKLGIAWKYGYCGRWNLEMVGLSGNPGNIPCDDLPYWNIVPMNSGRKELLEYLANESLPKVFRNKKFLVMDTMIPCNGDCSWDCA